MSLSVWIIFHLFIFTLLALDLGLLQKKARRQTTPPPLRIALLWSVLWIGIALSFNLFLYFWRGPEDALLFLTGYIIEKSLSIDNIFVFLVIFSSLKISPRFQHKILYYGIVGAMILRGIFIYFGITLLEKFSVMNYIFGGILIVTALRMITQREDHGAPRKSRLIPILERYLPLKLGYVGDHFFILHRGKLTATSLFVALLLVEGSDIIFAFDSVPAVLSVTHDLFLVYTSNIFAILGLRALYFALSQVATRIRFLNFGLGALLLFVGTKMILEKYCPISVGLSLGVIAGVVCITALASALLKPKPRLRSRASRRS